MATERKDLQATANNLQYILGTSMCVEMVLGYQTTGMLLMSQLMVCVRRDTPSEKNNTRMRATAAIAASTTGITIDRIEVADGV